MALLCNGARLMTNTCRAFSGVTSNAGGGIASLRGNFDNTGAHRCFQSGQHAVSGVTNRSGLPNGYVHKSWLLPQKTGGIAAVNSGKITFTPSSLNLAAGINITADGTVTFTVPNADMQLIVSANGTATIVFSETGALAGALSASGNTTFQLATNTPVLGAIISAVAAGTISFTADGMVVAIGNLFGDITPFTELSPENLASAVWNAVASSVNNAGTMGEKLNDAGSASNPWTEIIEGTYTAADIMKILAAVSAGKTTITDLGSGNATVTFRNLGDTKDRSVFDMVGSERTDRTEDLS